MAKSSVARERETTRNFVHRRLRDRVFPNLADLDEDSRASEKRLEYIDRLLLVLADTSIGTVLGCLKNDAGHESFSS